MSRSGYKDDISQWAMIRWRGAVKASICGKRGQKFLRDLRDALDSMPEKRLIAEELITEDGEVCAMGQLARVRGLEISDVDPEDRKKVAELFGIPRALACETAYENDEHRWCVNTPEERWKHMRKWVETNILLSSNA